MAAGFRSAIAGIWARLSGSTSSNVPVPPYRGTATDAALYLGRVSDQRAYTGVASDSLAYKGRARDNT
jgi:hypothetical protein